MSALKNKLKDMGIHNNWELLRRLGEPDDVAIEYYSPAPGRAGWGQIRKTSVWSPRKNPRLDPPDGMESGYRKTFSGPRKITFPAALDWATKEFGTAYVPSPFGGYIPEKLKATASALPSPERL